MEGSIVLKNILNLVRLFKNKYSDSVFFRLCSFNHIKCITVLAIPRRKLTGAFVQTKLNIKMLT